MACIGLHSSCHGNNSDSELGLKERLKIGNMNFRKVDYQICHMIGLWESITEDRLE